MNSKQRRFVKRSKRMNHLKLIKSMRILKRAIQEQNMGVGAVIELIDAVLHELSTRTN